MLLLRPKASTQKIKLHAFFLALFLSRKLSLRHEHQHAKSLAKNTKKYGNFEKFLRMLNKMVLHIDT